MPKREGRSGNRDHAYFFFGDFIHYINKYVQNMSLLNYFFIVPIALINLFPRDDLNFHIDFHRNWASKTDRFPRHILSLLIAKLTEFFSLCSNFRRFVLPFLFSSLGTDTSPCNKKRRVFGNAKDRPGYACTFTSVETTSSLRSRKIFPQNITRIFDRTKECHVVTIFIYDVTYCYVTRYRAFLWWCNFLFMWRHYTSDWWNLRRLLIGWFVGRLNGVIVFINLNYYYYHCLKYVMTRPLSWWSAHARRYTVSLFLPQWP